jgi:radical SAM protein with 4Fe4S-binding SPASM domain
MKAQLKPRINLENRPKLEELIPLATPLVVFVDPASACNFRCTFCPTGHPDLIAETGRYQGVMKGDTFCKIIDDLFEFDRPIKVLRLYKDGEPFLNKDLATMVFTAKKSGQVEFIDTTTNGSLMTPERLGPVLEAGIDRINISVEGLDRRAYFKVAGIFYNPAMLLENIKWLYANKGHCEVMVKIVGLAPEHHQEFYDTYGNYCDRISVENVVPCWPEFDPGMDVVGGLYGQEPQRVEVCPYIFYAISVNADGLVSACFQDWKRELIVGDVRSQSLRSIWNSDKMNDLRRLHLEGRRCEKELCRNCGQLTHCMADNIDDHKEVLLEKFTSALAVRQG